MEGDQPPLDADKSERSRSPPSRRRRRSYSPSPPPRRRSRSRSPRRRSYSRSPPRQRRDRSRDHPRDDYRRDYGPRGDYGPPRRDYGRDYGPPRGGDYGPPRGGDYGPPRGGDYGPPRGGDYGPPRGGDYGPPRGGDYGPPRGGDYGPPRGGDHGPPRGGGGRRGDRRGGPGQPGISLLIRNIGPEISQDDLHRAFGRIGEIRDVYIPRDYHSRMPKGFAFIEMAKTEDAVEAQAEMDKFVIKGCELEVVFAQQKRKSPHEMKTRVVSEQNRGRSSSFERHQQKEHRQEDSRDV